MITEKDKEKVCLNCQKDIPEEASFCPYCGQTTKAKKIGIFDSIKELFDNFIIFDFKIFRTLKALLIPGKITKDFFSGKHGKYTSPWRLFFIAIVAMLVVINIGGKITDREDSIFKLDKLSDTKKHKGFYFDLGEKGLNIGYSNKKNKADSIDGKKALNEIYNSITQKEDIDSLVNEMSKNSKYSQKQIDSITKNWIKKIKNRPFSIATLKKYLSTKDFSNIQAIFSNFDSTYVKGDSLVKLAIDSTAYTLSSQLKDIYIDSFTLYNIRISKYDINTMSRIELKKKYNIESKGTFKDAANDISYKMNSGKYTIDKFFDFALNNLNWFIIFLLPFVALIFKLLYIRRKRFFIEHLIFNQHNHTAILFLFTVFIMSGWFKLDVVDSIFSFIISFGPMLYYILAMKRYYGRSWGKTILKFSIFMVIYFFLLIISAISYFIVAAYFI